MLTEDMMKKVDDAAAVMAKAREYINDLQAGLAMAETTNRELTARVRELENVNAEQYRRIKELEVTVSKMENVGWVSVKDRMPTENDILFDTEFPFVCLTRYCISYQVHECDLDDIQNKMYGNYPIIAWMPLPPPPKEGE